MKDQEIENKKIWFRRYGKLVEVEDRLKNRLAILEDKLQGVRSPNYSGMPRGGRPVTIADLIADKEELEDRISRAHDRSLQCRRELLEVIDNLEDPKHAEVLELYFIGRMSIDQIAEDLGYNTRSIYRLYADAIALADIPKQDLHL